MSRAPGKLSIVCPAFDEEEVLPRFHAELVATLATLGDQEVEIIYVDDGSRDRTLEVIRALAAGDSRVRYVSLSRNFGVQAALTAGLEHALGDIVISMDSDLQHPPSLIPELLGKWCEGYEVVLTLRQVDDYMGPIKRITSRTFYQVMHWLGDIDVRAEASDYRLLSRKAVNGLLQLRETHRFLRGMVSWVGYPTTTVMFRVASRGAGVSKHNLRRLMNLAIDGLLSFSKIPLRLSLFLGIVFVVLGMGYGTLACLAGLAFGLSPLWPVHLGLTALFVVGGCVLGGLGVVGEYVGRVYEQVKGRPLYLVKESWPAEPGQAAEPRPGASDSYRAWPTKGASAA
jgi:glycosyltransferase involved in cell wall biosynthesis